MRQAMTSRKLFAVICLAVVCASSAAAQLVNENLLVTLPDGYRIDFNARKNNVAISEMVPAAENVHAWTEMVTVQVFFGMKNTPQQFRDRMTGLWRGICPEAGSGSTTNGVENGYPFALWLFTCPKNSATGKPENTWVKAIQGNDSFYVVQKAFKFDPSREQMVEWTRYLKTVSVCDSRIPERRCPAPAAKQP
jgi:hypothetical protein